MNMLSHFAEVLINQIQLNTIRLNILQKATHKKKFIMLWVGCPRFNQDSRNNTVGDCFLSGIFRILHLQFFKHLNDDSVRYILNTISKLLEQENSQFIPVIKDPNVDLKLKFTNF